MYAHSLLWGEITGDVIKKLLKESKQTFSLASSKSFLITSLLSNLYTTAEIFVQVTLHTWESNSIFISWLSNKKARIFTFPIGMELHIYQGWLMKASVKMTVKPDYCLYDSYSVQYVCIFHLFNIPCTFNSLSCESHEIE